MAGGSAVNHRGCERKLSANDNSLASVPAYPATQAEADWQAENDAFWTQIEVAEPTRAVKIDTQRPLSTQIVH